MLPVGASPDTQPPNAVAWPWDTDLPLARKLHFAMEPDCPYDDPARCDVERWAMAALDRLTAAGLLLPEPAEQEWGVRVWPGEPGREHVDPYSSRAKAEELLANVYGEATELVARYVYPPSPWSRVVPAGGGE